MPERRIIEEIENCNSVEALNEVLEKTIECLRSSECDEVGFIGRCMIHESAAKKYRFLIKSSYEKFLG